MSEYNICHSARKIFDEIHSMLRGFIFDKFSVKRLVALKRPTMRKVISKNVIVLFAHFIRFSGGK